MPTPALNLYVDQAGGKLVSGFSSTKQASLQSFVFGDSIPVNVRVLDSGTSRVWDDADLTNKTIRIAVGTPGGNPTSGTFTITYAGDTTSALNYNATAAQVQTALNLLASIIAAGGVSVTSTQTGVYKITFDSAGARSAFSIDSTILYPSTEANALVAVEGDVSTREVVLVTLETQPASYVELTTNLDSAAVSVSTIREGATGVGDIQQFAFSPVPYDGTYTITIGSETTNAISYNATAAVIQSALESLAGIGVGNVTVSGSLPSYTASFAASLEDVSEMTVAVDGLSVPTGKKGNLNLNTTGIVELLNGSTSANATFEVEIYDTVSSTSFTPVQTACTVKEDVTGNTPASSTPLPIYITTTTAGSTIAGMLGLSSYADLTAANAALTPGVPYWDVALNRLNVSTA